MIGSQPVAQMLRIHTQSQMEGGHTFSPLSFCSIGIQATKAFQMPATANVYGSRGIHLPLPPFADHSSNVCGNMNMGSHECMTGDLMVEQGRKLLEIHNICIYIYVYICIYIYVYIYIYIYIYMYIIIYIYDMYVIFLIFRRNNKTCGDYISITCGDLC